MEIVLDKDIGKIVRLSVVRPSGVALFDEQAIQTFTRAQPFGKAPDQIVSPDGNVYLRWKFQRDPRDSCTTRNAQFLMSSSPP